MAILPASFLFRFTLEVPRVDRIPRAKSPLLKLPQSSLLNLPVELDHPGFAEFALGWNPQGLCISCRLSGKSQRPFCSPEDVFRSDRLQLWIDTRDTKTVHRATRYCHHFVILPTGGDGTEQPLVEQHPVPRANEDAAEVDIDSILVESSTDETGYDISVWFPKDALFGFEADPSQKIGFFAAVFDKELGAQHLALDDDFPFDSDPSLWCTLQLQDS